MKKTEEQEKTIWSITMNKERYVPQSMQLPSFLVYKERILEFKGHKKGMTITEKKNQG